MEARVYQDRISDNSSDFLTPLIILRLDQLFGCLAPCPENGLRDVVWQITLLSRG
jgi:hypothetical protein